jgi:hypothetical protein
MIDATVLIKRSDSLIWKNGAVRYEWGQYCFSCILTKAHLASTSGAEQIGPEKRIGPEKEFRR